MSLESLQLVLHVAHVVEFDEMVPGRGEQPVAVPIPLHLHHSALVRMS